MIVAKDFVMDWEHFADWFNGKVGRNPWLRNTINKENFKQVLENWEHLNGVNETSLNRFVALFLIIYNETGGTFKGITEYGDDAYFFEQRILSNGLPKMSYNQKPNLRAGDQLKEMGLITSMSDVIKWNGTIKYPSDQPLNIRLAARNCDFYKFRGRGFMQVTWRNNYSVCFGKDFLHWTNEQLDESFKKIEVCCAVFQNYNLQPSAAFQLAKVEQGNFWNYGKCVSGGDQYAGLFQNRCKYLIDLIKSGT